MFHFHEKVKLYTKLVSRHYIEYSHQNLFAIFFIYYSIIYHFYQLVTIICKSIFYN